MLCSTKLQCLVRVDGASYLVSLHKVLPVVTAIRENSSAHRGCTAIWAPMSCTSSADFEASHRAKSDPPERLFVCSTNSEPPSNLNGPGRAQPRQVSAAEMLTLRMQLTVQYPPLSSSEPGTAPWTSSPSPSPSAACHPAGTWPYLSGPCRRCSSLARSRWRL